MKVGYFKVKPTVSAVAVQEKRELSLPPTRTLISSPRSGWKILSLPVTGLALALVLIGSMQLGVKLANYDVPKERYESIAQIDLPSNVLFTASVYESAINFFNKIVTWLRDFYNYLTFHWRELLGLESPAPVIVETSVVAPATSSPGLLFGGQLSSDKKIYSVMALPASGAIQIDESLKTELKNVFADPVDIKFDSSGRSGVITSILPGGERGKSYVFVLTPAR